MLRISTGIPVNMYVFKGSNNRHTVKTELDIVSNDNRNVAGVRKEKITIMGKIMIDKKNNPNVFFFDPKEQGFRNGYLTAKHEMGKLTQEEMQEAKLAGILSYEEIDQPVEPKPVGF